MKPDHSPAGKTKRFQLELWLMGVGGVSGVLSWLIAAPAKYWLEGISTFAIAAWLGIFLINCIAERKQAEAKAKRELTL
jgi:hypothetical protein